MDTFQAVWTPLFSYSHEKKKSSFKSTEVQVSHYFYTGITDKFSTVPLIYQGHLK